MKNAVILTAGSTQQLVWRRDGEMKKNEYEYFTVRYEFSPQKMWWWVNRISKMYSTANVTKLRTMHISPLKNDTRT